METKYLKEVKRIFGYHDTASEDLFNEVANYDYNLYELIENFESELELNIVSSNGNFETIVRFYISSLTSVFYIAENFEFNKTPENNYEKYLQCSCNHLFQVFNTIEHVSFIYNIDFFKILEDMGRINLLKFMPIIGLYLDNKENQTPKIEKIKWAGTPSQFGFIFRELAEKGFIELPKTHGDPSNRKFAKICFETFEIDTTQGNLEKELNPEKHTLSPTNQQRFIIPFKIDLD